MAFVSKYLKLVGALALIGYFIGIFFLFSMIFSTNDGGEIGGLIFQLFFYIIFGPAVGIALMSIGYLIDRQEEDEKAEAYRAASLSFKERPNRVFSTTAPWTCKCGKENKATHKVCLECGLPRTHDNS